VTEAPLTIDELRDAWPVLAADERFEGFMALDRESADDFFLGLPAHDQAIMLRSMPQSERRLWFHLLPPDDAADVIQEYPEDERAAALALLDDVFRREIQGLLAYAEDAAGGLMSPRFARLRPEMTVDEAMHYLRRQAREHVETLNYSYVLDVNQRLIGVVSFRDLFRESGAKVLRDVMQTDVISVLDTMDQEAVARVFAKHSLNAIPVVDAEGHMKGIVTADDIVEVVQSEATEDIQKLGGMQALDIPYMRTSLGAMVKKRAGWLSALFLGEMLTASAMGHYEAQIAQAVVLALFIPLIISSGGNSGSQATTLIIRAMALGEVGLRDWWRIMRREITAGLALGLILATIGMIRIVTWQWAFKAYGAEYLQVAASVAVSIIGVVTWGTVTGSMLPIIIRRLGFDPASASAPFVATLVDVSGLMIYFNVARLLMHNMLH
jgi:magnesium transporter